MCDVTRARTDSWYVVVWETKSYDEGSVRHEVVGIVEGRKGEEDRIAAGGVIAGIPGG